MSTEETPLLRTSADPQHGDIYLRFSGGKKKVILAIVAWNGLIPCTNISNSSGFLAA